MKNKTINILFIADIIGKPGLQITSRLLDGLRRKYRIHFCIANGENGASGKGLNEQIARQYFSIGIDVITSGNHIWDNRNLHRFLDDNPKILRPLNYPRVNHGNGSVVVDINTENVRIGVINLQGRTYMYPIDCPFRIGLEEIERIKQKTKIIIVDFHAEATAEKMAIGWYLDGKVSAVIGTHTHVQTADERILPRGTAYITDVGMTGPYDSVIGLKREVAIKRFTHQIPVKYQPANGNLRFCGVVVSVNPIDGRAVSIERLMIP